MKQKTIKSRVGHQILKMQGTPFFSEHIDNMKDYFKRLVYSNETIISYIKNLKYFFNWVQKQKLYNINQEVINKYLDFLDKQPISSNTIKAKYNVVRHYDKFLQNNLNQKIITKPSQISDIHIPKNTDILTIKEINKLYNETEESILGLRDRALLSLFYGCGLRNKEGTKVKIHDFDYKRDILEVKPSKNYQNRFIPLSPKVVNDLFRYQKFSRPYLIDKNTDIFLLNNHGKPVTTTINRRILKKIVKRAGIDKNVTIHLLRHSLGTHLLQKGMFLEQIARLLGHKSLDTTQIYAKILKSWKN